MAVPLGSPRDADSQPHLRHRPHLPDLGGPNSRNAFGIKAKSVAKAIEWAVRENVDVISMSFALSDDPDNEIKKKIELSEQKGIVMVYSAHDESSRIARAYPAVHRVSHPNSLLVIAACDEYGNILHDVEKDAEHGYNGYDYMLRGQNIPASVVLYIKSEENISGSSVATALAAGLCSLILTGDRLAQPGKT
ncbi:Halolysin [Madurella mycetomatis]|uniref:Halolysin n=1 Tax=Madurella mycetomatis TaxID=100816 RepID=A0A175VTV2_9PEZI|nr:Halolysin [Madurella mycetomatis]